MVWGTVFNIEKIKHFITTHAATVLPENEYLSLIEQGRRTVLSVMDNETDQLSLSERKSYLDHIVSLIWYFYALGINKNQGFLEGVMVLEDPDQRIYTFLHNYIKKVNHKNLLKRSLISTNPYGYPRQSTHFTQDQKNFIQYGIDIRLINDKVAQKFLPGNKAHILFGRLANGLMFIKLERYGLYYKDGFIGHAGGFLKLALSRITSKFVTPRESRFHRKEYMPQWIKRGYRNFYGEKCRLKTIKDIIQQNQSSNHCDNLVETIKQYYDHTGLRYGNELILGKKEIESFL